jgi:hypothetical protein
MADVHEQGVWARAADDTAADVKSPRFGFVVAAVNVVIEAATGIYLLQGSQLGVPITVWSVILVAVLVAAAGTVGTTVSLFAVKLAGAPFRQRDHARQDLAESRAFISSLGAPKLTVMGHARNGEFTLLVRNDGSTAMFSAMTVVKIKDGGLFESDMLNSHHLSWLQTPSPETQIIRGGTRTLVLARLRQINPATLTGPRDPRETAYELVHEELTANGPRECFWLRWGLGRGLRVDHPPSTHLDFDVEIRSDDERATEPFRYQCSIVIKWDYDSQKFTKFTLSADPVSSTRIRP